MGLATMPAEDVPFRYGVRPAGLIADMSMILEACIAATGARAFLELRPFQCAMDIDGKHVEGDVRTNGMDAAWSWDNRNFSYICDSACESPLVSGRLAENA